MYPGLSRALSEIVVFLIVVPLAVVGTVLALVVLIVLAVVGAVLTLIGAVLALVVLVLSFILVEIISRHISFLLMVISYRNYYVFFSKIYTKNTRYFCTIFHLHFYENYV